MKTNYPLGTIGYCTACGNYCELRANPEGEFWALLDERDLSQEQIAEAVDIDCGCNA